MKVAIAVSALALLAGGAPAAAGQSRAVMSVTAVVAPACSIAAEPVLRPRAEIACSTGASVSTLTAEHHEDRPLADAETRLGRPVRRGRAVVFTAPSRRAPAARRPVDSRIRYLTITY